MEIQDGRLDRVIPTWTAYAKDTGEPVLVDDRTFSPDHHTKEPPAKTGKPKKE